MGKKNQEAHIWLGVIDFPKDNLFKCYKDRNKLAKLYYLNKQKLFTRVGSTIQWVIFF